MKYFVTAIGTDSGKTLVSAILCEALHADYWKPVQAGTPRDADTVRALLTNTTSVIHPEKYVLQTPASPHAAAKIDGVEINVREFNLPETRRPLVLEGAGGCMVPLNDREVVIDLAIRFAAPIVLVSNYYLGSINHTLLTAELLRQRNLPVKGIVFNGRANPESRRIILHHTNYPVLLEVNHEETINAETVRKYAMQVKPRL